MKVDGRTVDVFEQDLHSGTILDVLWANVDNYGSTSRTAQSQAWPYTYNRFDCPVCPLSQGPFTLSHERPDSRSPKLTKNDLFRKIIDQKRPWLICLFQTWLNTCHNDEYVKSLHWRLSVRIFIIKIIYSSFWPTCGQKWPWCSGQTCKSLSIYIQTLIDLETFFKNFQISKTSPRTDLGKSKFRISKDVYVNSIDPIIIIKWLLKDLSK